MEFSTQYEGQVARITELFRATFSAAEGVTEGAVIGGLVQNLLTETSPEDIHVFTALKDGALVAGVIITRLAYAHDARKVFLLSPMAVASDSQGQGIGQALLQHVLDKLREAGVDILMTFGDPRFYGKLGFTVVGEEDARPPLPLSQPHGWLGQSLQGSGLTPLQGPSTCVAALNNQHFW
jgi:predicted N-acetyltransferase YhbS